MDFEKARFNMVEQQIRPWDVLNTQVLDLLFHVKREEFVSDKQKTIAFVDTELPLPNGSRMLEPKMEARLVQELNLAPEDKVLEIGTGWGAMAEYAARHYGCRVTTTTLSQEQYIWATERIARAGLQDRVEVLLCDYRDLTGQYDKLVSIEMIEAVGQRYLPTFFRTCQARLRPGGRMAIQAITIQDQRYRDYSKSVDFIQRYISPAASCRASPP